MLGHEVTYDTQTHEELDDHVHGHKSKGAVLAEGVVVDLNWMIRSSSYEEKKGEITRT
jgi:hypothetical protein